MARRGSEAKAVCQRVIFLFVLCQIVLFMFRTTHPDGTSTEISDDLAKKVYTVASLAERLEISERSAYDLIRKGHIAYCCAGSKNYRVGEPAVQHFLLGLRPLAA
jgi:excisionase family DNA binding protein